MAGDNTIALLSNICKKLDVISQTLVNSNTPKAQSEAVQRDIINNKVTGLKTAENIPQPEVKPIQPNNIKTANIIDTNISIKDIIDFLKDLPIAVKAVTGMNGLTINRFEKVLNKLSKSISSFAESMKNVNVSNSEAKKFKNITDSIASLEHSVKGIAKMAPLVPLFDLSMTMMVPGIKLLVKVLDMLSKVKDTKNAVASIKVINDMMRGLGIVVASTIAMAIAIKVLGASEILKGVGIVLGVVTVLSALAIGISALSAHIKTADKDMKNVTIFIGGMMAMTAATLLLGVLINNSLSTLMTGLGGVLAVTLAYSGIAIGIAFVGSLINGIEKANLLNEITKFIAWNIGITAGTMLLGAVISQGWPLLAAGFAGVVSVMTGYTLIIFGLLALNKKIQVLEGSKSLLNIAAFEAACLGIAAGTILLGHMVKNNVTEALEGFAALTTIIVTAGIFAKLADKFKITFEKGSIALKPMGVMMAGAGIALLSIAGFLAIKNSTNISWGDTFIAIGAMSTIVAAFGALAGVAGMISAQIIAGAPALLATSKMALISEGLLLGVITLVGIKNKANISWGDTFATIGAMATIVTSFGALAAVAGLASVPIAVGTAALGLVSLLALASMGLLNNVIDLKLKLDDTKITNTDIEKTISTIKFAIQGFVNLVKETSVGGFLGGVKLMTKSSGLTILMNQMSYIAQSLGSIAAVTTSDGKIRPAKFVDGKLVTGEPVDILASAKTISNTVREFTKLMTEDFKNISLKDMVHAKIAISAINNILDPISNFVNALMGFETGADGTLHTVKITDDGKIINGPDVHLETVANTIASSISTFAKTLFSKDNAEIWAQFKYGEDAYGRAVNPSSIERGMGVLSNVIDPISKFVDCLSKFEGGDGDNLTMPIFDNDGKVKGSRKINVVKIANTIANAVTTFANQIASHASEWEAIFNKGAYTERQITKSAGLFSGAEFQYTNHESDLARGMGVFGKVISPIISFIDCMTKFTVTGDSISILDGKGVAHKTDLKKIATKISEAVTNFITSISSLGNATNTVSTSEIVGKILNNTTKPVVDFANALIPYADAQPGWLPIFKADGTKEREINIIGAADNIVNCVNAYTNSINNIKKSILADTDKIGEAADGISNYIKAFAGATDEKQIKKIDKFEATVGKTAKSFSKLDDVLAKGNEKRIKSINDLSTAVEKLANTVQNENISKLASLFTSLSNVNSGDVAKVAAELSKLNIGSSNGKTVYAGGNGTSKDIIIAAIREALDTVELTPDTASATVTYATNNSSKITGINIPSIQINTGIDNY